MSTDFQEAGELLKSHFATVCRWMKKEVPVGYCVAVWLTTVVMFIYWG